MEQYKFNSGKLLVESYSSVSEVAEYARERASGALKGSNTRGDKSDPYGMPWHGATWADALTLARTGWDAEMRSTMDIAESAVATAEMEYLDDGFSATWDVAGAEVDMGRYLSKVPECMIDYPLTKVSVVGRVVTMVAGKSVSRGVGTQTMVKMGQVTTALALALDRLGLSTEIYVDTCQQSGNYTMCQKILVKGASDSLDPSAIQFALAHPAMFRRLCFATWDNMGPGNGNFTSHFDEHSFGRGSPGRRPDEFKAMYPEGTIFFPNVYSAGDVPNADQFLRKYLKELGLIQGE